MQLKSTSYFLHDINGWESWERIFRSTDAFGPLIRKILADSGLSLNAPVDYCTPGTNAVFATGPHVIKIYAPRQSGQDTRIDFLMEWNWLRLAPDLGVPCPKLIASGQIPDKYVFRYLVMERVDGLDAKDVIFDYSQEKILPFISQIKELMENIHKFPRPESYPDLKARAASNPCWQALAPSLVEELQKVARSVDLSGSVPVHGDLTGENIMVRPNGEIAVLDFANCVIAPWWYELPPVILDLFRGEVRFVRSFVGGQDPQLFLEDLVQGLSLHSMGGALLKGFIERSGGQVHEVSTLDRLRQLLEQQLFQ